MELIKNNAAYIHPTAQMYGKVELCSGSSLWPYTVIRSEMYEVNIGEKTNIRILS
jgi:carbonic anhydrase/acetyltransferase-like protein (isoleucine patch superfamily)